MKKWHLYLTIFAAFSFQLLMYGHYRKEDIDDAWYQSLLYNFSHKGIVTDQVFGIPSWNGFSFASFGFFYGKYYAWFLDIFGWTRDHGHLASLLLLVGTSILWYFILKKNFSSLLALTFCLLLFIMEPFMHMSHMPRPEALILFLNSLALLCLLNNHFLSAGIIVVLAIETHPVGASSLFWLCPFLLQHEESKQRKYGLFLLGILVGLAIYLSLHRFSDLGKILGGHPTYELFLIKYYFRYPRHIPELLLVIFSLFIGFRNKLYERHKTQFQFFASCLIFSFLFLRGNYLYAPLVYPAFLLIILIAFEHIQKSHVLIGLLLLNYSIHYGVRFMQNRTYDLEKSLKDLSIVSRVQMTPNTPVFGRPNHWFAFIDRDYYSWTHCATHFKELPSQLYLIETDDFRDPSKAVSPGTKDCHKIIIDHYSETNQTPIGHNESPDGDMVLKLLVKK